VVQAASTAGVAFMPVLDRAALAVEADNPQAASARCPELMAACQSFEAVLLSQLMRVMRQGESQDKLFGGGLAEGIYGELLDDQLTREMATSGDTGIAQMLYDQLEAAAAADTARAGSAPEATAHGTDTVPTVLMEATYDGWTRRRSP
jgi:Rod binding domain-containing protein